jgi:hypothetical protein
MTSTIRVRQLLSALNPVERTALKKLLPPKLTVPEEPEGTKYPAALLAQLAEAEPGEQYSLAGFITEDLLHYTPAEITVATLLATARNRCPVLTTIHEEKIAKSKTTEPYLAHLRETRKKMRLASGSIDPFRYEEEVGSPGPVRGHPDMRTDTKIFEIKMTGRLKENWQDFLYQVFAYAALAPEATDIYLVLPLQEMLWHFDARAWYGQPFLEFMETAASRKSANLGPALALIEEHRIGSHMPKLKTLAATVDSLPTDRPSQIFLAGPQSSKLHAEPEDEAAAAAIVAERGLRLFVHSAYLINLCSQTDDGFHSSLLIKTLQIAVAIGARGVVVHVGKATTQELSVALATMRTNLTACLEAGGVTPDEVDEVSE